MNSEPLTLRKALPPVAEARPSALAQLRRHWARWVAFIILTLGAVVMIGPFVVMVSYSFQPAEAATLLPFKLLPIPFSLDNYAQIFARSSMLRWFFNSVVVAVVTTTLQLFTNSLAGYTFARKDFPGRNLLFWLCMAMLVVPFQVTLIPLFILFSRLGLHNNFGGLILISVASIFGTFFFRQYILGIPRDYDDAARVDGCSEFGIYWRVILPQCTPVIAVLGAFTFIGMWNSYLWPLLIITSQDRMTLPVGLALLQGLTFGDRFAQLGQLLAAATFMAFPTILALLIMQKYIIRGVAMSGIKG